MVNDTLTVIVVSRGLDALLGHCLQSVHGALKQAPVRDHHVVVVDNGSDVPYTEAILDKGATDLVRFDVGACFARANNHAARVRPGGFYLLLNNDVLLESGAIADMFRVMIDVPAAGICGTRLLFPDGTIQHCGVVFGDATTGPYHYLRREPGPAASRADREWQAVTGACMLVRGAVWHELDGLDEGYPGGLEDIDFCLRARQIGWRVYCANLTDSLHFESLTSGRVELDVESRRLFMQRWLGRYAIDG